jgi:hypothetical protein
MVEVWLREGLFKRGRVQDRNIIIEIPVGKKMRFCNLIISKWFESPRRDPREVNYHNNFSGTPGEAIIENRLKIKKAFSCVQDAHLRILVLSLLVSEKLLSARQYAQMNNIRWPQFVLDFNYALEQVMIEMLYV